MSTICSLHAATVPHTMQISDRNCLFMDPAGMKRRWWLSETPSLTAGNQSATSRAQRLSSLEFYMNAGSPHCWRLRWGLSMEQPWPNTLQCTGKTLHHSNFKVSNLIPNIFQILLSKDGELAKVPTPSVFSYHLYPQGTVHTPGMAHPIPGCFPVAIAGGNSTVSTACLLLAPSFPAILQKEWKF